MTDGQTRTITRLNLVPPVPRKPHDDAAGQHRLSSLLIMFFDMISNCFERSNQRRSLSSLNDQMLRDIGLSRYDVEAESRKPFWLP